MNSIDKKKYYLDFLCFMSIGIFSLGYVMFIRPFAEIHIQFSFLNFPIFLGEILLALCFFVFLIRDKWQLKKIKKKHVIIIAYFAFVIFKALYGYSQWGPLAFRHAALFYYPVFIIFSYSFYHSKFFDFKKTILYLSLILLLFISRKYGEYWVFTCFSLAFVLSYVQKDKRLKYLMLALLIVFTPYRNFFASSRMMMVSNGVVTVYLIISFYLMLKLKKSVKFIILVISIALISGGVIRFSDKNALKSIVNVGAIVEIFEKNDVLVNARLSKNKMESTREIRIYNPEIQSNGKEEEAEVAVQNKEEMALETKKVLAQNKEKTVFQNKKVVVVQSKEEVLKREMENLFGKVKIYNPEDAVALERVSSINQTSVIKKQKEESPQRPLTIAYANAVFRLFIWRDMLVELVSERPVFGFDFGKPLRPKSLLALNWASLPMSRDGWIAAHNSYLHMIYRAGIVGSVFIITILTLLFRMVKDFIRLRSVIGILLSAILINWFVAANFLLIFELPYTAIPIWSLFGLVLAYQCRLREKRV